MRETCGIRVCDRKETVNETVNETVCEPVVFNIKRWKKYTFVCVCEGERVYWVGGWV